MKRVLNWVVKVVNGISWVGIVLSGAFMLFMIVVIVQGVFWRRVLHDPQGYSLEFSRYSLMPMLAFALAYTQMVKGHVAVDFLTMHLPRVVQKILLQIVYLIFLAYAVGLILAFWDKTMVYFRAGMTTEDTKLPFWLISVAMPIGLGALCLQLLVDFARGIAGFWSKAQPGSSSGHSK